MSVSPIRKIWISLLSIVAMLMSSYVSSAPLMTFQMLSQSQSVAMASSHCGSGAMKHHDLATATDTASSPCDSENNMTHNCCSAVCSTAFALFTHTPEQIDIATRLALIRVETAGQVVSRQTSLYRPPIA